MMYRYGLIFGRYENIYTEMNLYMSKIILISVLYIFYSDVIIMSVLFLLSLFLIKDLHKKFENDGKLYDKLF